MITTRRVKVVIDSGADVPPDIAAELDITVIPLLVHISGKTYQDGVDISGQALYAELEAARSVTSTSLPSLDALAQAYRRLTCEGYDVVSIHISSKLSGTFNAALMASTANGVPPESIAVVDSRTLSMAHGWVAICAAEAAREGKSLDEVEAVAVSAASRVGIYGALDTLEYVVRSGRLGKLPGAIGNMLDIKPILTIKPNGEAEITDRLRSSKKALERIVELTTEQQPLERLAVLHGANEDGANRLMSMLQPLDPPQPVITGHIGAVLGTHLGPGAVGVCFLRKE
ncbi:MAG: DegV family protein [Chloroflexia bacterium]